MYPVTAHPKCVAAGNCQGFCLREVVDSHEHGLIYGPGDALGFPIHYGEVSSLME